MEAVRVGSASLSGSLSVLIDPAFSKFRQPRDVLFSLGLVLLKRSFELFRLRRFSQIRQGAQDFLFRKIDVLEGLVKQFLQVLVASHAVAPWVRGYLATGRQNFSSAAAPGPAANNKRICGGVGT